MCFFCCCSDCDFRCPFCNLIFLHISAGVLPLRVVVFVRPKVIHVSFVFCAHGPCSTIFSNVAVSCVRFLFFLTFFSCCNVDIFTCFTVVLLLVLLCCDCCGCLRGFFRAVTFASLSYHQVSHLRHSHLPKFHSVHLYVCCELTCSCVDFHLSCVSLAMSIRSHS